MLSKAIALANEEVKLEFKRAEKQTRSRGKYSVFTDEEKAKIGKRSAKYGVASTMRFYALKHQRFSKLKQSSVKDWRKKYLLAERNTSNESVVKLLSSSRGRPLLLGKELDRQVQRYLEQLRENGSVVNSAIAIACAIGVVKSHDRNLLQSNGGYLSLSKSWAKSLLRRMGYVKRRATTSAKSFYNRF